MRFDIISIFPESFSSYFSASILRRAQEDRKIEIHTHNLRDFTYDKHRTVDDTPYGGGAGMVLKIEPLVEALESVKKIAGEKKTRTLLFSAKGEAFSQKKAVELSRYERLIFLCGRYEGVDERIVEYVDEEISVGEYVLTGGELPAMIVVDAVARLLPGVLGNIESAQTESYTEPGLLEYPQYTKPEVFREHHVPEVLLSGHHSEIEKWRTEKAQEASLKRKTTIHESFEEK